MGGEGPRNSWFVCFNYPNAESHPAYLASTSPPKKKGARTRRQGPPPGGAPHSPRLAAVRGPFHFLPASPLRTRETNVGRANQLQKRGPERSGTQTRDPRQPAAARAARAGRAPSPAAAAPQAAALRLTRPGPPARRQPPPDHGVSLTALTGLPAAATPPRANLLPSALPAAKPRVTPKSSGREAEAGQRRREAGGARGGAAPRLIIPASRDLPGPPAAAPQGPLSPEAPPPACLRSRSGLGSESGQSQHGRSGQYSPSWT